ncbi:MAG: dihydrolipoamide succinyltransferase, partial [Sphingobacteriaceae bacterium]|nr:dihydrolipoamide succinyltransferase [Cytophagaceae bacterium]
MSLVEMKVPTVGESVTEVTIAAWNKKEGDTVKMDEVLCELESDKATFELPAEAAGVLHLRAKEGDTLPIGAVICAIETVETGGSNGQTQEVTPPAQATQPVEAAAAVAKAATPDAAPTAQPVPMPVSTAASPQPAAAPAAPAADAKTVEVKVPPVGESITEVTIASWNKKEGDLVK